MSIGIQTFDSLGGVIFDSSTASRSVLTITGRTLYAAGTDTIIYPPANTYFFSIPADGIVGTSTIAYGGLSTGAASTSGAMAIAVGGRHFGGNIDYTSLPSYLYYVQGMDFAGVSDLTTANQGYGVAIRGPNDSDLISQESSSLQVWEDNTQTVSSYGEFIRLGGAGYAGGSLYAVYFNKAYYYPPLIMLHGPSLPVNMGGISLWHYIKNSSGQFIGFTFVCLRGVIGATTYTATPFSLRYRLLSTSQHIVNPVDASFGLAVFDGAGKRIWNSERESMSIMPASLWTVNGFVTYSSQNTWALLFRGMGDQSSSKQGTDNYDINVDGVGYYDGAWSIRTACSLRYGSTDNTSIRYAQLFGGMALLVSP